jgi:type I restriction enzyme S subunit
VNELYKLPDGWKWSTLSESYIVKDGTHDSPKYINENGYPLFTSKNLKDYGIDVDNYKLIGEEDYQITL